MKEHIAEYGGDPDFVVITGGSAGGHLSALAALTAGGRAFQPGFEDADTSVQAAVPMYGVYDFTNRDRTGRGRHGGHAVPAGLQVELADAREVWEQASPMTWVGPEAPPFFIAHGANDSLVPVEQARSFARMLREASDQPVVYAELPRRPARLRLVLLGADTPHPAGDRPVPRRRPHRPRRPCRPHRGCRTGGAGLVGGPDAMTTNRRLVLAQRPHGLLAEGDVRLEEVALPDLEEGEALMRTTYLSIDPTVRTWVSEARSYFPPVQIGEVVRCSGTGVIVDSRAEGLAVGDLVYSLPGWQEHAVVRDDAFTTKLDPGTDLLAALGVLGNNGITAWIGMLDIGQPEEGQTVVVSAAAGATGSIAGQLARSPWLPGGRDRRAGRQVLPSWSTSWASTPA